MTSYCRACGAECADSTKRFDESLGFICTACHDFLETAKPVLLQSGIEGMQEEPETDRP